MQSIPTHNIRKISEILEEEGYKPDSNIKYQFQYSILKDPELTIVIGARISIEIPFIHQPPIELVSFYISLYFRPRWMDVNFENTIRYLAVSFREKVLNLKPYTHDFNIDKYKTSIINLVEKYYPPENLDEDVLYNEYKFYAILRDKFLQNSKNFEKFLGLFSKDIFDIYRDFRLQPCNDLPPEFYKGIPKRRRNYCVVFKNEDPQEFLLEEPGSLSYWRDYAYENIWIRTAMESNTVNFWYYIFRDQDFKQNYLFYDWLIYTRGLIKPIMEFLDAPQFIKSEIQYFGNIQFLQEILPNAIIPGLYLPKIVYDCSLTQDRYQRDNILFSNPPGSLEESSAMEDYNSAISLIQKGNFNLAEEFLELANRKLKKFHHTEGRIKVIFKLVELAEKKKDFKLSVDYLNDALELAKTGKVDLESLIKIHIGLTRNHALLDHKDESNNHFLIPIKFLESLTKSDQNEGLIFKLHLEMAKLRMSQNKYELANEHLKSLRKIKTEGEFDFLYYYYRSIYYEGVKNQTKQLLSLQKAVEYNEGPLEEHIEACMNLGKFYLYTKNDAEKSLKSLNQALEFLQGQDIDTINLKIKINEMLHDAYQAKNDEANAARAGLEIQKLRERLDRMV